MGMLEVALFASLAGGAGVVTIKSTLSNQVCCKLGQTGIFPLRKSILDGDVLALDPPKLAQFISECLREWRDTRSSAVIQKTDAMNFSWLLRLAEMDGSEN